MPTPSFETTMRSVPPASTATSTRPASASSAFSTSSLTTEAGRSITSPAAIRSRVSASSSLMSGVMYGVVLPVDPRHLPVSARALQPPSPTEPINRSDTWIRGMEDDATVRLLVVAPDGERASSVATAVEEADDGRRGRFEVRTTTTDGALEALAAFDANCVVSDATDAGALLTSLDAARPALPVVLFYADDRSSEGSATTADDRVAGVVRFDAPDCVDDLLELVEAAIDPRDRSWYRSLLDSTTDIIAVVGPDGRFQYLNRTVESMLGYEPDELVGTSAFELVHEDDREAVLERFYDFAAERGPEHPTETFRVRDADGRWRWVESTGQNRFRGEGTEGYVVCVREIAERRRREQELARYETIVESAPVGLFVLDENGVITWANDDYAETLGIPRQDLAGTSFLELVEAGYYDESVPEEYLEEVRELLSSRNEVEEVSYPVETYRDGERRIHEAHITLLPLEDGEFRGTVVAYRDVTKQKEYEAELERQNERLDRFASTVSHDLRNPLSVAKGHTQIALEDGDLEALEHVTEAHDRMESLVEGVLALARDEEDADEPRPVALEDVAESAWESVDDEAATMAVAGSTTVVAAPSRLRQLLENLFRNSVEHGSTSPDSQAHEDAVENGSTSPGSQAHQDVGEDGTVDCERLSVIVGPLEGREGFYVADDGRGVPPADRDRIFDHGYTTNEGGTGLGLGIVQTVAEDHGWAVEVTESADGGARFEVETGGADDGRDGDHAADADGGDGEVAPETATDGNGDAAEGDATDERGDDATGGTDAGTAAGE
jgi:PAS domain S-box-containing protein